MGETRRRMSSKGVGNATDSSLKAQPAHGASDVQDVSQKINQDEFFAKLDSLIGSGREQKGCAVGAQVSKLEEPLRNKLNIIMKNPSVQSAQLFEVMNSYGICVSSSDLLRRHRRRLMGREGCKCSLDS